MSIEVRSHAEGAVTGGSGTPISAESQPGDVAVLFMSSQSAVDTTATIPPGWSGDAPAMFGTRSGYVAYRAVTDPAQTQGVDWWYHSAGATTRQRASLVVLAGADVGAVTPWSAAKPTLSGTALVASVRNGGAGTHQNAWTGGTIIAEGDVSAAASWTALRVGLTDTIADDPAYSTSVDGWAAVAVAEKTDTPAPAPATLTVDVVGDASPARVAVWDGSAEQAARSMGVMPYGAASVSELLTKPKFVVAHRGGSGSWPEHTKRAYTQAVDHGVDALEVSCSRTSDGVWFGLHDKTLKRLGGPDVDPATMTWEEVESAMAGTQYVPARLDWLLDTYGRSHTILFDPKYETARSAEYLSILEPYKANVIIKYSGDGTKLFQTWHDAGFTTWAYGYASWKAGNASAWSSMTTDVNKDILSMEYGAPSDVWADLKATGKPVTSHIPPDAAAVEAGWAAGAVGSIVAGVASYLPSSV